MQVKETSSKIAVVLRSELSEKSLPDISLNTGDKTAKIPTEQDDPLLLRPPAQDGHHRLSVHRSIPEETEMLRRI